MNLGFEPMTLDWNLANDSYSFDIISNIMVGLSKFGIDSEGAVISEPACAQSWTINENADEYLFELDPKCTWSDGESVKAQDFIDSFKRVLDPLNAAPYADLLSIIDLEKSAAINDTSLKIKLKHPAAYFIYLTSYGLTLPIRKDLIDKYGDEWTEPGKLVSNGPFKLKNWRHEYKIVLEENPAYTLSKVGPLEFLEFFMVPEQSSAFTLYRNNQFDWIDNRSIPSSEIKNLERKTVVNETLRRIPLLRNTYLGFNTSKKPFKNAKLRKAFAYAIDREKLVKILAKGHKANVTWIVPGLKNFFDASLGLNYDPDLAVRLFQESLAEYKIQGIDLREELSKTKFLFPSNEEAKLLSETLQAMWQENLGVKINLVSMEWKVFLDTLKRDTPDIFRLNWGADYPDPDTFMQLFSSKNQINYGKWSNLEYDELVAKAASVTDLNLRKHLYQKAEKILLNEETAIVPLFVNTQMILCKNNIEGLNINPMDIVRLDLVTKRFEHD
jgi:oligopeptide transport system substrate-binding protein